MCAIQAFKGSYAERNERYKQEFATVLPNSARARTVFDLSESECRLVEDRMRGVYGRFLYEKGLLDVTVKDLTSLSKRGVSCDVIKNKLTRLLNRAQIAIDQADDSSSIISVILDGKFQISNII